MALREFSARDAATPLSWEGEARRALWVANRQVWRVSWQSQFGFVSRFWHGVPSPATTRFPANLNFRTSEGYSA